MMTEINEMSTPRLIIRRFLPEDWRDLHEYLSNAEVLRYEPYEPFTEEQSKQEAIRRAGNEAFWAVCLKDSGKLIGNVFFEKQDFDTWELGYVFNSAFWGNGYATESAKAVVSNAFKNHNARRIKAMCDPLNAPSWKLMERLGMRREGFLIQNVWFKKDADGNPIWKDTYMYAILNTEWEN